MYTATRMLAVQFFFFGLLTHRCIFANLVYDANTTESIRAQILQSCAFNALE